MKVLVCNAGSSTLKFSLFEAEEEELLAYGLIDWTTKPARLRLRHTGQPEVRAELTVGQRSGRIGMRHGEVVQAKRLVGPQQRGVGAGGHA